MRKGNLIKMAAPAILSAAMMVSGLPVMAADLHLILLWRLRHRQMSLMQQMTPLMLLQAMRKHLLLTIRQQKDEFAATAETGYKYVYGRSDMGTVLGI